MGAQFVVREAGGEMGEHGGILNAAEGPNGFDANGEFGAERQDFEGRWAVAGVGDGEDSLGDDLRRAVV